MQVDDEARDIRREQLVHAVDSLGLERAEVGGREVADEDLVAVSSRSVRGTRACTHDAGSAVRQHVEHERRARTDGRHRGQVRAREPDRVLRRRVDDVAHRLGTGTRAECPGGREVHAVRGVGGGTVVCPAE